MEQSQGQAPKLARTSSGRLPPDESPLKEARLNDVRPQKKGKIKDRIRETIIWALGVVTTYLAGMWQRCPYPWDRLPGMVEKWQR